MAVNLSYSPSPRVRRSCSESYHGSDIDVESLQESPGVVFSPGQHIQRAKSFYQCQTRHTLGKPEDKKKITITMMGNLLSKWKRHLRTAVVDINEAAPGLSLHLVEWTRSLPSTIQVHGCSGETFVTHGNILDSRYDTVKIELGDDTNDNDFMKATALHELLHALGFDHEHQRNDASYYVTYHGTRDSDEDWYDQFAPQEGFQGLTTFDPFSVMFYPESNKLKRREGNPAWDKKPGKEMNIELSELDKVGLNILYPPCRSADYNPYISNETGMWYCNRNVMENHNRPAKSTTNGDCSINWANCPSCRTLKNDVVTQFLEEDRWQGSSGLVYCGQYFGKQGPGHDGYCGPDYGTPCPRCRYFILPRNFLVSRQMTQYSLRLRPGFVHIQFSHRSLLARASVTPCVQRIRVLRSRQVTINSLTTSLNSLTF